MKNVLKIYDVRKYGKMVEAVITQFQIYIYIVFVLWI
jgi:hypothetical protein